MRVIIIGTGLIGTSIALALREHEAEVWLADQDPGAARLAADLGAGDLLPDTGNDPADVAVIAVPRPPSRPPSPRRKRDDWPKRIPTWPASSSCPSPRPASTAAT